MDLNAHPWFAVALQGLGAVFADCKMRISKLRSTVNKVRDFTSQPYFLKVFKMDFHREEALRGVVYLDTPFGRNAGNNVRHNQGTPSSTQELLGKPSKSLQSPCLK